MITIMKRRFASEALSCVRIAMSMAVLFVCCSGLLQAATVQALYINKAGAWKTGCSIVTQPAGAASETALATQPKVQLTGVDGVAVRKSGVVITATLASGYKGTLSNAITVTDGEGIATFHGLTFTSTTVTDSTRFKLVFTPGGDRSATSDYTKLTLAVGNRYQGGIIFYFLTTGQQLGTGTSNVIQYSPTEQHGLIAATQDQGGSRSTQYSSVSPNPLGTVGAAIGTGQKNTQLIVALCASASTPVYGAKLCDDLVLNGYSDWYQPSEQELLKLAQTQTIVGMGPWINEDDSTYWSSSHLAGNHTYARYVLFNKKEIWDDYEFTEKFRTRAVRSF
jgi:hypothetical protein